MGHPDKITPDVVEWIVSDDKVVVKWKEFARRLNLDAYVAKIDENHSYKRKKFEKQKMKELFEVWQRSSPITFTKHKLMDILSKEQCSDMYMWLQLMNTHNNSRKSEIAAMMDTSRLNTPRSTMSLSPNPTYQRHSVAYTPTSGSLPNSPYPWYFESKPSVSPGAQGILKRGPRPASGLGSNATASSTKSDDYQDLVMLNGHGSAGSGSRESTPDSLTRPLSNLSMIPDGASLYAQTKPVKSIRFADDPVLMVEEEDDEVGGSRRKSPSNKISTLEIQVKSPRKGTDNSVEKYFDNLISMIEEAASELK